jgi:two-component system, NtrC family, response regulator HydG
MNQPIIAVLSLNDAFEAVWPQLATDTGAELRSAGSVAELAPLGSAEAVLVACGGAEDDAFAPIAELGAAARVPVVVAGANADHLVAIALVRAGAGDYFALPGDQQRLRAWFEQQVQGARARVAAQALTERERASYDFSHLIGESAELQSALQRAARIIPHADATVLITGESGTGKELLAQAIHYNGPRASHPIIEVNCTALPATLLEAELFGYEKGAFTGANAAKPGLFEAAHGGTIFLDEIGDLSPELQAKLLRALETRQVRRLGSVRTTSVDVRVIAATHVDLAAAVRKGAFREDLYYRLSVVPIHLPPLRARGSDVFFLAQTFLRQFAEQYALAIPILADDVRGALLAHAWPGNVRELRNAVERAVLLGDGGTLRALDLIPAASPAEPVASPIHFPAPMDDIEKQAATAMVAHCSGNKTAAASALGISRSRLYRLLGEDEPR